jgi:ABC-2 type transport system ATP-binding protein
MVLENILNRIINQITLPDSGSIILDGEKLQSKHVHIGYLPEERGLYNSMKVESNVCIWHK